MSSRYVGIDVSKKSLDVWVNPEGVYHKFSNTPEGVKDLMAKILPGGIPTRVVCEASGGYEGLVAETLRKASWPIHVVSPGPVKFFFKGLKKKVKTDRLDAEGLALYAAQGEWTAPAVPDAVREELKALAQRRNQLVGLLAQEKTHREHATGAAATDIAENITSLEARLQKIETQIAAQVKKNDSLAKEVAILDEVPGIGPVVSVGLAARLPELGQGDFARIASLVGLAPYARESGTWKGKRWIKGGRAEVRRLLFLAVWGAIKAKSVVAQWRDKFLAAGKLPKVADIACARKLLKLLHIMKKKGLHWSELRINASPQETAA